MKVFKFGGASIKDASSIRNMAQIVSNHKNEALVIVVSAMGKTTNALENLYELILREKSYINSLNELKAYHYQIIEELFERIDNHVLAAVDDLFKTLEDDLNSGINKLSKEAYYDKIVTKGELISSKIIHSFLESYGLKVKWINAKNYVTTDSHFQEAIINWDSTKEKIKKEIPDVLSEYIVLTQGFLGGNKNGDYTTLGREGSDFSAAIFASCLKASAVTIWKDVPGILNADPNIIKEAVKYDYLDYFEAAEMTYYGAKVIHPKTIKPLANLNIPLFVKSFERPHDEGTEINKIESKKKIPAIIYKPNQCLISFRVKDFTFINENNLSIIFHILDQLSIKINMMQNSAISLSLCIDDHKEKIPELMSLLKNDFEVFYDTGLTLITVKNYDYDESYIEDISRGKNILLEQKTQHNFQIVVQ